MYYLPSRCLAALFTVSLFVGLGAGAENEADLRKSPTVKAVQKVKPSVVAVKVTTPAASDRTRDMTGTGLIIDERGYIVTNRHVVAGSTRIIVRLLDGTELTAEVLLADPETDLAVLRVKANRKLPAQALTSSKDLEEGEDVIAVGHPLGYTYTVSRGIVSALNRKIPMPNGYVLTNLIQTDASINPGNSGGPLLNIHGGVIGINVALREDAHGIAFAISSETVKRLLKTHLASLKVIASAPVNTTKRSPVLPSPAARQEAVDRAIASEREASARLAQRLGYSALLVGGSLVGSLLAR